MPDTKYTFAEVLANVMMILYGYWWWLYRSGLCDDYTIIDEYDHSVIMILVWLYGDDYMMVMIIWWWYDYMISGDNDYMTMLIVWPWWLYAHDEMIIDDYWWWNDYWWW